MRAGFHKDKIVRVIEFAFESQSLVNEGRFPLVMDIGSRYIRSGMSRNPSLMRAGFHSSKNKGRSEILGTGSQSLVNQGRFPH
mgnify:FL=1